MRLLLLIFLSKCLRLCGWLVLLVVVRLVLRLSLGLTGLCGSLTYCRGLTVIMARILSFWMTFDLAIFHLTGCCVSWIATLLGYLLRVGMCPSILG